MKRGLQEASSNRYRRVHLHIPMKPAALHLSTFLEAAHLAFQSPAARPEAALVAVLRPELPAPEIAASLWASESTASEGPAAAQSTVFGPDSFRIVAAARRRFPIGICIGAADID
jgi:hypothetical protein